LPVGCQPGKMWGSLLSVSRVTSPVPSAFTQYKLGIPNGLDYMVRVPGAISPIRMRRPPNVVLLARICSYC
jgi:hypothetical protein